MTNDKITGYLGDQEFQILNFSEYNQQFTTKQWGLEDSGSTLVVIRTRKLDQRIIDEVWVGFGTVITGSSFSSTDGVTAYHFVTTVVEEWKEVQSADDVTEVVERAPVIPQFFSGRDYYAYTIRGEKVEQIGNLEAITWSIQYGRTGNQRIIGSAALTQWDRDAIDQAGWRERGFDFALVGMNDSGATSMLVLQNIRVTQSTHGVSMNDLGSTVGVSFVCESVIPWHPVEVNPYLPDWIKEINEH